MKLALIADTFPPLRTSGATQLFDLAVEIACQGHDLTVFIPADDINESFSVSKIEGFTLIRVKVWKFKEVHHLRRGAFELLMPYLMLYSLRGSSYLSLKWNGIIWYSPSIFLGPFVKRLKKISKSSGYLIVRDIFPGWLVDLGLLRKGLLYLFLKFIEIQQYKIADTIGVQAPGNLKYFSNEYQAISGQKIEVLHNWLGKISFEQSTIKLSSTSLRNRKIFIYTGNMGVAQGVEIFLELAKKMKKRGDVGFVFIGRGSELEKLKKIAISNSLLNVLFFDEVPTHELGSLYRESVAGLLALDKRHLSHNIPGKFLSYMRAGIPALAIVNEGNDLISLMNDKVVGKVTASRSIDELERLASELIGQIDLDKEGLSSRCLALAEELFSPKNAVTQILATFSH